LPDHVQEIFCFWISDIKIKDVKGGKGQGKGNKGGKGNGKGKGQGQDLSAEGQPGLDSGAGQPLPHGGGPQLDPLMKPIKMMKPVELAANEPPTEADVIADQKGKGKGQQGGKGQGKVKGGKGNKGTQHVTEPTTTTIDPNMEHIAGFGFIQW